MSYLGKKRFIDPGFEEPPSRRSLPSVSHRQPQIPNSCHSIPTDQNVLTLQVPVSDGRLALSSLDLQVEVSQAGGDIKTHLDSLRDQINTEN